jgi:MauM/NapG family ferredoxin protein
MDRRRFFREGLRELLRPMSKAVEPLHRVADELGKLESIGATEHHDLADAPPPPAMQSDSHAVGDAWLRPPGALQENLFLETCSRCAKCVEVCPAQCIKLDPERTVAGGAPYIDVDTMPCVLCTGLECMHYCPTGALARTPLHDIDMGTAVWHEERCVRSHGEPCTMCVDHCPLGTTALELANDRIVVHEDGCTGCGVCQNNCPTTPKSITVTPVRFRDAAGTVSR